ncbi:MAG: hypothetical protein ABGX20_15345 [Bacillus sp. (in: firmicutes)]
MYEEKEALLKKYYQLTLQLVREIEEGSVDCIPQLLDERQACIDEVTKLDYNFCQVIMNQAIKERLLQISPLEVRLQEKLKEIQQRVLSTIHSLKKEKNIKQQYGEPAFVSSGLFYDKRK